MFPSRLCYILRSIALFLSLTLTSAGAEWQWHVNPNNVRFVVDTKTTLWAATTVGLVAYDKTDESFTNFGSAFGPRSLTITAIEQTSDGHIWVGTSDNGLHRFNGSVWNTLPVSTNDGAPIHNIVDLAADRRNGLWIAGADASGDTCMIALYSKGVWRRYESDFWDKRILRINSRMYDGRRINSLMVDSRNDLWVIGRLTIPKIAADNVAIRCNAEEFQLFNRQDLNYTYQANRWELTNLAQDSNGDIWIGNNFYTSRYADGKWRSFERSDKDLSSSDFGGASILTADPEQGMWAISWHGFSYFDGSHWIPQSKPFVDENVRGIVFDNAGRMFLATTENVFLLDSGLWRSLPVTKNLDHKYIHSLSLGIDGTPLATGIDGIVQYAGGESKRIAQTNVPAANAIQCMATDRVGNLWVAYDAGFPDHDIGISRYAIEDGVWRHYTTDDGLIHNSVWSMTFDRDNRLWAAGAGGVSCYDGRSWITYPIIRPPEGFEQGFSSIVCDSANVIWTVGYAGNPMSDNGGPPIHTLHRFDGHSWRPVIDVDDTLHNLEYDILCVDLDGIVWLSTREFVYRTGSYVERLHAYDGKVWQQYDVVRDTVNPGFSNSDPDGLAIDSDGSLWLWSSAYTRYTPARIHDRLTSATTRRVAGGVSRLEDGVWRHNPLVTTPFKAGESNVKALAIDRAGAKWLSFGDTEYKNGVVRYDTSGWMQLDPHGDLFPVDVEHIAIGADGSAWFAMGESVHMSKRVGIVRLLNAADAGPIVMPPPQPLQNALEILAYPNPVQLAKRNPAQAHVDIRSTISGPVLCRLYTLTGKLITETSGTLNGGQTTTFALPLKGVTPGAYLIAVLCNGREAGVTLIVEE